MIFSGVLVDVASCRKESELFPLEVRTGDKDLEDIKDRVDEFCKDLKERAFSDGILRLDCLFNPDLLTRIFLYDAGRLFGSILEGRLVSLKDSFCTLPFSGCKELGLSKRSCSLPSI